MKIDPRQFINPGIIKYDEKRRGMLARFKEAVRRARFLNKNEKRNWTLLGYILRTKQLEEAERLIISEDLRCLKIRQKLEKIKPKPKRNG